MGLQINSAWELYQVYDIIFCTLAGFCEITTHPIAVIVEDIKYSWATISLLFYKYKPKY